MVGAPSGYLKMVAKIIHDAVAYLADEVQRICRTGETFRDLNQMHSYPT